MKAYEAGFLSMTQAANLYLKQANPIQPVSDTEEENSFAKVLEQTEKQSQGVKFSKHANQRLQTRNIELSDTQLERLNSGIDRARTKKIQESLVMMDNLAFIVNVKNNTVVTAMQQGEEDAVFTNIDGAVIV
ncbi:MAG: TIGR02530 family flagellar biosynthesis protein [Wujia sp.]